MAKMAIVLVSFIYTVIIILYLIICFETQLIHRNMWYQIKTAIFEKTRIFVYIPMINHPYAICNHVLNAERYLKPYWQTKLKSKLSCIQFDKLVHKQETIPQRKPLPRIFWVVMLPTDKPTAMNS